MSGHKRQMLLLLKGHPGSGKSTLAGSLSRELSWPLIDKDDVRDLTVSLEEAPLCCPRGVLNTLSYDVMWRMVERQLSLGLSVVVDCPLARPTLFQTATAIAARYSALTCVVECRPSDVNEWRRRLETRAELEAESQSTQCRKGSSHEPAEQRQQTVEALGGERKSDHPVPGPSRAHGGWHKPRSWGDMESILTDYDGCWEYDMGSTPAIVLDTTALKPDEVLSRAAGWVGTLMGSH